MARPKDDISTLPEGWYKYILDLYIDGASDVEVKALIYSWRGSFSNDLWDRWLSEEPEFSETIKMGRVLAESWWAKSGRSNLQNKDFNYTGWYMQMKNRYGWTDRQTIDNNVTHSGLTISVNKDIAEEINKVNDRTDKNI